MSRGPRPPVMLAPTRCTTLELKDLADTQEFDVNAEIGAVYGIEYTNDGYYKRVEVTEGKKHPKLEQLRNVEADITDDFEYKLVRKENKWHLFPVIDWEIKLEFISPYTFFGSEQTFRKAFNFGPLHVSLIAAGQSRREIEIKPFKKRQYLLHRKDSVIKKAVTKLQFLPKMPLADQFTMVFDISILKDVPVNGVVGVSDILMKGVQIAWQNLDVESLRAVVIIQNNGSELRTVSSSEKVNVTLNPSNLTELLDIDITHLDLIGFYYTESVLSAEILNRITNSI
eukprot:TRINITY_DN50_c0_g2_i2.p2 TRINITY_DN50_c0_g2~~TRINITY_DN50_c0_g2_i2.p2  ORF type:complete len:284 (+),score=16.13 TRINITY_DN50_c0_g2_i2:608-1459(+)